MTTNRTILQTSLKIISQTIQFILGFVLGVSLIAGTAVGAGYYYFTKMSSHVPTKPVYEEETASETATKSPQTEDASNTNTPEPASPAPETETIPKNAYYARVTWPQGLSLRSEPSLNSTKIGGVGYNVKILILGESSDKQWQRIQIPGNKQEGWVKNGNVKKVVD